MSAEPPSFGPSCYPAAGDPELEALGLDGSGPRDVCGLTLGGVDRLVVLGDYWTAPDDDPPGVESALTAADKRSSRQAATGRPPSGAEPVRTEVGELVHQAKDSGDEAAAAELGRRLARLVGRSLPPSTGPVPLVVGVPSCPVPAVDLPAVLAEALATAGIGEHRPGLLVRRRQTPKLRDLGADPAHRYDTVAAAGYEVAEPVAGRAVVLVDDVILTGATLRFIAAKLQAAGAASAIAAAAARTRRR